MKRRSWMMGLPLALGGWGLGGCAGGLFPKPAALPGRYGLDDAAVLGSPALDAARVAPVAPGISMASGLGRPVLAVAMPRASAGSDTTAMLYLRHPHQIEAFAQHVWADTPAQMLAPLLVRALERQGALAAVLRAPSGARADLQLETDVLTLEQDFNVSPSVVRLALRLVLLDAASRRPLATREFAASQAAPSEDAEGGVAAAQALTRRVLGEVSDWVVSSLAVRATALTAPAHR